MVGESISNIADLKPDSKNARKHNQRNLNMIVDALHEVGAARSIVIDENGVILAGNGVVEAAADAGIERVQVVDADGETIIAVRRTGLTDKQKTRLALLDNRTAELADWDAEAIAAEQLGRRCYGMDIEPKYVAVALQRMADMGLEPRLCNA
ncbi:MAG: DNA modification methylase [Anaerolineae bacterium]|nr:DNA modification methylase [Anaerolineae bacterium]